MKFITWALSSSCLYLHLHFTKTNICMFKLITICESSTQLLRFHYTRQGRPQDTNFPFKNLVELDHDVWTHHWYWADHYGRVDRQVGTKHGRGSGDHDDGNNVDEHWGLKLFYPSHAQQTFEVHIITVMEIHLGFRAYRRGPIFKLLIYLKWMEISISFFHIVKNLTFWASSGLGFISLFHLV